MIAFVARRLGQSVLVLFAMSLLVFAAVYAIGNPIALLISPNAPQEVIERTVHNLGLDQPFYVQYLRFLAAAVRGDLGISYVFGRPALVMIAERFPATLELVLAALAIAVALGLPIGLWAGYWSQSRFGRFTGTAAILGISMPNFFIGLVLIILFSIELHWLPTGGRGMTRSVLGIRTSLVTLDGLRHIAMPAFTLALFPMVLLIRLVRGRVRENMQQGYVRFARAKGLGNARILFVYVLRQIMVPIVTVLGVVIGVMLAFSVVTETVFAWPGVGKLIIDAMKTSDRPVIIAYLLCTVVVFTTINFVVDVLTRLLDPRIGTQQGRA